MPDGSHQRDRDNLLEDYAAAAEGPLGFGIRQARNKKSYIVNIRPKRWKDKFKPSQFWKGKIKDREFAMLIADAILHYCGKPGCHFGDNAPFTLPFLRTLRLSTPEERSSYVQSIAGSDFRGQRRDFIDQVMDVINSPDFIRRGKEFLGTAPGDAPPANQDAPDNVLPAEEVAPVSPPRADEVTPLSSAPIDEGVADSSSRGDGAGRDEECETPLEEDPEAVAMVARFASGPQPGASVAGFELDMGRDFDANGPSRIESVQQPLAVERCSIDDCPSADDEGWIMAIEELNKNCAMVDQVGTWL